MKQYVFDEVGLRQSTLIANMIYFGFKVSVGNTNMNSISPAILIRNAIKYQSITSTYQDIWDDPNLLQAHKYQNIPQIDLSTYQSDYVLTNGRTIYRRTVDGLELPSRQYVGSDVVAYPIEFRGDHIDINYVYSANKQFHQVSIELNSKQFYRLIEMCLLDRIADVFEHYSGEDPNNIPINARLSALIFSENDTTHMVSEGKPYYNVTLRNILEQYQSKPYDLYVPYRRGWSRVLNIAETNALPEDQPEPYNLVYNDDVVLHMLNVSSVTTWDGKSTRIENHGVEVEDMKSHDILGMIDRDNILMRRLEETHEYIRQVSILPAHQLESEYITISTIKGVNINGFEFNMP